MVSILGGSDLSMADVNQVMADVNARCPQARVIMGAAVAADFGDRLAVTVIATSARRIEAARLKSQAAPRGQTAATAAEFGAELLHPTETARPKTRMVVPRAALTVEQREEIITKHTLGGNPPRARPARACVRPRCRSTS